MRATVSPAYNLFRRWRAVVCSAVVVVAFGVTGFAQTAPTLVTNIAQLREKVAGQWRLRCGLDLTGVVCAVSAEKNVLVLADDSGAERFTLDFCGQELRVGQSVNLSAPRCEIIRRPMGLAIRRSPLVDNDGAHGTLLKTSTVSLPVGRHPLRLEWFNSYFPAELKVEVEPPGLPRQKIPDEWLSHRGTSGQEGAEGLLPGLQMRVFEGNWYYLPDFGELRVTESGSVSNLGLTGRIRQPNVGVEFTGYFEARVAGDYKFHVTSDDGSLLYLGEPLPRVKVLGEGKPAALLNYFIGQIVGKDGSYRWTRVEGFVRQIVMQMNSVELEMQSRSGNRMRIDIADAADLPLELLVNSQIRVVGVNRDVVIPGGQRVVGALSTVGRREIQIMELPPETWSAYRLTTISNLVESSVSTNRSLVRLTGTLYAPKSPGPFLLKDATGGIQVERSETGSTFLGKPVEVLGVLARSGTNLVLGNPGYRRGPEVGDKVAPLPRLTTADQVLRLGREEAARGYPVLMRGVVTCTWPDSFRNAVLQDLTRGVFVRLPAPGKTGTPKHGEFWEVEGVTRQGFFSPIVEVGRMVRVSEGRMPAPVEPTWDQLLNGSLDAVYVEIECVIVSVDGDKATLLTHWGKINVEFFTEKPAELESAKNKLVRIRGCLLAAWDEKTHQVQVGKFRLGSATISAGRTLPSDPFEVPEKSINEILQFDIQASSFQRVKVTGQIVQERGGEYFMTSGTNGVRFVANETTSYQHGDVVEVAGIPELGGPSPVLREAFVRRTGRAVLPPAKDLAAEEMNPAAHDAKRVCVEGTLLEFRISRGEQLLEMQSGARLFTARLREQDGSLPVIAPQSRLALTGVCVAQSTVKMAGQAADSFELLLGSASDVTVLVRPPWWTLKRLLVALGILLVVLAGAGLWVVQLRRRVQAQTEIISETVKQAATQEERSRIARELHDTLEQSLAGISFQLGAVTGAVRGVSADAVKMLERARLMVRHSQEEARRSVRNLRTFALERGDLASAIETMARDSVNGMPVKIETVVNGQPLSLSYLAKNHLLRIGQEALTNALKHGRARTVRFELSYSDESVALKVTDDGCGFDVEQTAPTEAGHFGLLGMRERVNKLGGTIQITSQPGAGATVSVAVPRNQSHTDLELL